MLRQKSLWTVYLLIALAALIPWQSALATTYTVTNTSDSGAGSLRWAIEQANAHPGADIIDFNIPAATDTGCNAGTGVCTIQPATALPSLTDDLTTIDGYSQAGTAPATGGTPATILIQIDGSGVANNNGFNILSAGNVLQGLAVNRFPLNGIAIGSSDATGNIISGNHIGLDPSGAVDLGNGFDGVFVTQGATNNVIGGDEPAERNVISGNGWEGVALHDNGTMGNTVSGNYIGVSADGATIKGNTLSGVRIYGGAQNNLIGGGTAGERNLISGNLTDGVLIEGAQTVDNVVSGNHIGTNITGTSALPNDSHGVEINLAIDNLVGGDEPGERNVISGNGNDGIYIRNQDGQGNVISGNYIGVDATGTTALPNDNDGVTLLSSEGNQIGGDTPGERNVISGNGDDGITISGSSAPGNIVIGNYIGVDTLGEAALPNQDIGVNIATSSDNLVGGSTPGARNVISGNGGDGVSIRNPPSHDNIVAGNYIGVDAAGTMAIPNFDHGILIDIGAHHNRIGGNTEGERNIISSNGSGILIGGGDFTEVTSENSVLGNHIGLGADGLTALGNDRDGVHISVNSPDNTIGPGNIIGHNGWDGVRVDTPLAVGNTITENSIFSNADLGIDLTNGGNNDMPVPNILSVPSGPGPISGTALPGSTVEVFASQDADGEGEVYLGSTTAGGAGDFTLTVPYLLFPHLTATATDLNDGTSEFSSVFTGGIPVLHIDSSKSVDRATAAPGEMLLYTITLSNTGTSAPPATLTDTLTAEVTWANNASASAGTLTWESAHNRLLWSGNVEVGATVVITFQVQVNGGLSDGETILNIAAVESGSGYVFDLHAPEVIVAAEKLYLPIIRR